MVFTGAAGLLLRVLLPIFFTLVGHEASQARCEWEPQDLDALRAEGVRLIHQPAEEGVAIKAFVFVAASRADAVRILWDHERFPEFLPQARSVRILKKRGNIHDVEQVGGQGPFVLTLLTERHLLEDGVSWRSIGGDLKRNDGALRVQSVPRGTVLQYQVHLVTKQSVPVQIIRFLQGQALPKMLLAFKERIEKQAREGS